VTLAQAIERRQWQVAALMLLIGVSEAASRLPPESLAALLDLLAEDDPEKEGGSRA
jgi:hypothetical protein